MDPYVVSSYARTDEREYICVYKCVHICMCVYVRMGAPTMAGVLDCTTRLVRRADYHGDSSA